MKKKKYFIIFTLIFIYIFFMVGQDRVPIEELDIINGLSYDIKNNVSKNVDFLIGYSAYVYKPTLKRENVVYEGRALNIGEVHQEKQKRTSKKIIGGQERAVVISENYARHGINAFVDERFRNSEFNDMAYVVVGRGVAEDYLRYKQPEFVSSSEFIFGLVDNINKYNFFSKDEKVVDIYVRLDAEGRSIVLPYISIEKEGMKITGSALFKKDKMVAQVDMENTRILNLLRNQDVVGMLSLQDGPEKYIDFYAQSKNKKVKCYKDNDKYNFVIDLNLTGKIVSNLMYKDITEDINEKEKFEKDMAKRVEEMCSKFIKTMQKEYKVDCLELGRVGAAEFGRRTNVDWDEVITNANIKINVKVKVNNYGRGFY